MTDTPAAAPAMTLESALAAIRNLFDAQPEPAKTYLHNALADVELAVRQEIDAAIMAYANKIPIVGGIVGSSVEAAINNALDAGLIDINGPAA
jgi:hypothetical protein